MAISSLTKIPRLAGRGLRSRPGGSASSQLFASKARLAAYGIAAPVTATGAPRFISWSAGFKRKLSPFLDTGDEEPKPKGPAKTYTAAKITETEYHRLADEYMQLVLSKFEELQESREDMDVEYSAGVMTVDFGRRGTYVINKQPPNKQIWLSSPKTGPKRYDWVIMGDTQQDKEGTAMGDWVYLRDNSTMGELFKDELGINLGMPVRHYGF